MTKTKLTFVISCVYGQTIDISLFKEYKHHVYTFSFNKNIPVEKIIIYLGF